MRGQSEEPGHSARAQGEVDMSKGGGHSGPEFTFHLTANEPSRYPLAWGSLTYACLDRVSNRDVEFVAWG